MSFSRRPLCGATWVGRMDAACTAVEALPSMGRRSGFEYIFGDAMRPIASLRPFL